MKNSFLFKAKSKGVLFTTTILFTFFLSSCTFFFMKVTGNIRNPKLENSTSIIKCCKKWKDPYDLLWVPNSKKNFNEIVRKYDEVPMILIFDKNFSLLNNVEGKDCTWKLISYFNDSLIPKYKNNVDSSYFFVQRKCKEIDKKMLSMDNDYTIVYIWAKYGPKLSKSLFASLTEVKQKYKSRVRLISLNKDWQKDLHEEAPRLGKKNVEKNEHTKKNKSE